MSRDTAEGSVLTAIVAYEASTYLTGWPRVTDLSRRHPVLAYTLAGAWLAHVFWRVKQVIEELEACDEWH